MEYKQALSYVTGVGKSHSESTADFHNANTRVNVKGSVVHGPEQVLGFVKLDINNQGKNNNNNKEMSGQMHETRAQ